MISYEVVEHGKPLQRALRDTPKPTGGEVLVRVTRSGVCHSDLHIWDGYFDLGGGKRFYVKDRGCVPPFTMGHEPFGIVEALGPDAKGVAVGAKRVVYPWIGCGECAVCKAGQDNYCLAQRFIGVFRPGAYASHLLVPTRSTWSTLRASTRALPRRSPARASRPTARSGSSPPSPTATGSSCSAAAGSE